MGLHKAFLASFLLLFCTKTIVADMAFGRDAVNTNENNWNNYTKVNNSINFTQVLKFFARLSSRTIINASINICNEIRTALTQIAKNTASQVVTTTVQTARDACGATFMFLSTNKWRIIFFSAVGAYSYLVYTVISLRVYFNHRERWFNWNEHLTLEALCATSQKELGVELIKEIQRRYTLMATPTDFVTPLINFLREIDEELQSLELYFRLGPWVKRLKLCTLTGFNNEVEQRVDMWRRRVIHLRTTFMKWMADYKLEHNTAARSILDPRFPFIRFITQHHFFMNANNRSLT